MRLSAQRKTFILIDWTIYILFTPSLMFSSDFYHPLLAT